MTFLSRSRTRSEQRMRWLLNKMVEHGGRGFLVAWDEEVVDAFVEAFPEAERTLRVYTMGPNSCPLLNRAARKARDLGYLEAGVVGNMDARSYNQRTWCRTWSLTSKGRSAYAGERA